VTKLVDGDPVAHEIFALEQSLLRPEVRSAPETVARLLSDEFIEFGQSGRLYTKEQLLEALPGLATPSATISDFRIVLIATDVMLATYRCGDTLRSSLWRREAGQWRLVFHQGTRTADAPP
jgi:hypothetical protein